METQIFMQDSPDLTAAYLSGPSAPHSSPYGPVLHANIIPSPSPLCQACFLCPSRLSLEVYCYLQPLSGVLETQISLSQLLDLWEHQF